MPAFLARVHLGNARAPTVPRLGKGLRKCHRSTRTADGQAPIRHARMQTARRDRNQGERTNARAIEERLETCSSRPRNGLQTHMTSDLSADATVPPTE